MNKAADSADDSLDTAPAPRPPRVPGYESVRLLGRGAFGAVWLARQENTGKQVAIKVYPHMDRLDIAELKREVRILAALYAAREIVQLIEVGWEASPPYFVMEYLEHGSLEDWLRRQPLAEEEALHESQEARKNLRPLVGQLAITDQ